jgi:hypothetical protein
MKFQITLETEDRSAHWSEDYDATNTHVLEQGIKSRLAEYNSTASLKLKLAGVAVVEIDKLV